MISYKLIRSKRKTLALYITKTGEPEVRAPIKLPLLQIEQFIEKKINWASKKQREKQQPDKIPLVEGALLQLFGETLYAKSNKI